jgi:hypothetical protein
MNTIIDKETAYCFAEINEGVCKYLFSIHKDATHVAECDFKLDHARAIKGYMGFAGGTPRVIASDPKTNKFTATMRTDFLEFHIENLEDWIIKREITLTEEMKVLE